MAVPAVSKIDERSRVTYEAQARRLPWRGVGPAITAAISLSILPLTAAFPAARNAPQPAPAARGRVAHARDSTVMQVTVDATDISRKLFHSVIDIPVRAGPLTLVYPKWIYNAPSRTGINNVVRLVFTAGRRRLPWRRDSLDMYALHLGVPHDVRSLRVDMDVLPARRPIADPGGATSSLFVLEWHQFVLYPASASTDTLQVQASLKLPHDWKYVSTLAGDASGDGSIDFPRVSLATLADSPVLAGSVFSGTEVRSGGFPPLSIDVAGEAPENVVVPPDWFLRLARLRAEAGALFGGYPHPSYRFLLALSDELGHDGLEHLQSSDIRVGARFFSDDNERLAYGYLIPHEYVHAWNGKFRIPRDLVTRNFQQPVAGDLLWVYEGLTRYLNWLLAARSGILSLDESREYAAFLVAEMDHRTGREWRSLQDTATAAQLLYVAPGQWESQRRGTDFYDESFLVWLEVDATVRRLTGGTRSLDDFCKAFFRPPNDHPRPRSYLFDDVVAALNRVAPYDWARLLRERLDATGTAGAPLDGLSQSGWTVTYNAAPNVVQAAHNAVDHAIEERFSIGMLLEEGGTVLDVVGESSAWRAGIAPGMKLTLVDRDRWSLDALGRAIEHDPQTPIDFVVQDGSRTFDARVEHTRGLQYPHLERSADPDLIADILKGRATPED
jgi:predicted metalloprotease with PDZ domain